MKYKDVEGILPKAIKGDEEAFAHLCEVISGDVLRICTKIMGNQQDGEDARQEVFISLQKGLPALQKPETFPAWMNRVIANVCRRQMQKKAKASEYEPIDYYQEFLLEEDTLFIPPQHVEDADKRQIMLRAINSMPEKFRQVVTLYYYREMTIEKIAEELQLNFSTVDHRLRKARVLIRKELGRLLGKNNIENRYAVLSALPAAGLAGKITTPIKKTFETVKGFFTKGPRGSALYKGMIAISIAATTLIFTAAVVSKATMLPTSSLPTPSTAVTQASPAPPNVRSEAQYVAPDPQPAPVQSSTVEGLDISSTPQVPFIAPESTAQPQQPPRPQPSSAQSEAKSKAPVSSVVQNTPFGAHIKGKLVPCGPSGQPIQPGKQLLADVKAAILTQSGATLGRVPVQPDGTYQFNINVTAGESYTVQFSQAGGPALQFAQGPGFTAQKAQTTLQLPDAHATDAAAPQIGVQFFNYKADITDINPASAQISCKDALEATCTWQITNDSGENVAGGMGTNVQIPLEAIGPEEHMKTCTLTITAEDAVGNTATTERQFRVIGGRFVWR